jgi:enoyl-CoA hydratase/carnithine racemase
LTGARLNAKEMIAAGLATHFVPSEVRHSAFTIHIHDGSGA